MPAQIGKKHLKLARDANRKVLASLSALLEDHSEQSAVGALLSSSNETERVFKLAELRVRPRSSVRATPSSVALLESHKLMAKVLTKETGILWMSFALDNLRIQDGKTEEETVHDFGLSKPVFLGTHESPEHPGKPPSITKWVVEGYLETPKRTDQWCFGICLTEAKVQGFEDRECVNIYLDGETFVRPKRPIFAKAVGEWEKELRGDDKWSIYIKTYDKLVRAGSEIRCLVSATSFFNSLLEPRLKAAAQLIIGLECIPSAEQATEIYHLLQVVLSGLPMAWNAITRLASDNLNLSKYRDILNLLQRPLDQLEGAINSMQQNVRSLNAVLYEPSEALFHAHRDVVELFEDGRTVVLFGVSVIVQHESKYDDQTDAAIILAVAASRILGVKLELQKPPGKDKKKSLESAQNLIQKHLDTDVAVFGEAAETLLYVCFPEATSQLPAKDFRNLFCLEVTHKTLPVDRVGYLKSVLFTPFKLEQRSGWHAHALQVALRGFGKDVKFVLDTGGPLPLTPWMIPANWTPIGYGVVLDFLMKCCAEYRNRYDVSKRARNKLAKVCVRPVYEPISDKELKISLYFEGRSFLDEEKSGGKTIQIVASELAHLLKNHVLEFPRDWRIDHITLGNFHRPFVNLCNKILGLHQTWGAVNPGQPNGGQYPVLLLLQRSVGWEQSTKTQGSRCFEIGIGAKTSTPGIYLRWYQGEACSQTERKDAS